MLRLALVVGVLVGIAFWIFLLTGHGEDTGLIGVMAFLLIVGSLVSMGRQRA